MSELLAGGILMIMLVAHVSLASLLFLLVNRIGKHAVEFGYGSTTLFEEPNESLALNFFIRALAPGVFIVALSALAVATGQAELRLGIYRVAVIYYVLRALYIFLLNMQRLVSWPRYLFHAGVGIGAAFLAYHYLILPNRSLLPDWNELGNELWLAILAFLYAAANQVKFSGGPGDRRRNRFVQLNYEQARRDYGPLIDGKIGDDRLKLITYAVLVYESYCRPPSIRLLERLQFWKASRTTGIMQVAADESLSDEESVALGTDKLLESWQSCSAENDSYMQAYKTITDYNYDENYVSRVMEVMTIVAKRVAPELRPAYKAIMGHDA